MKEKAKRYSWVFIILVVVILFSILGSFDNFFSRKIAEVFNKPLETVQAFFASSVWLGIGALLIMAAIAFAPVVAVVAVFLAIVGVVCLFLAAWTWFGSKSKPDNTSLGGLK